ncbi:MAG: DUF167 family protein [Candidatus Nanoarchaeia archaeon]|nr:DUF167 family protein [Candidatus Nanoarchaeia archaeon]
MNAIKVIVKTKSGKSEVAGFDEEKQAYRVNVKAVPENGKANIEVMKILKKHFKKDFRIISGFTSKEKLVAEI